MIALSRIDAKSTASEACLGTFALSAEVPLLSSSIQVATVRRLYLQISQLLRHARTGTFENKTNMTFMKVGSHTPWDSG